MQKRSLLQTLKSYSLIVFGTLILSFGVAVFILPFDLVCGGVSGIAILISNLSGDAISVELIITILTWALFFVGLLTLGKSFALKTLISSIVYPLGIALFSRLATPSAFGGFFDLISHSSGAVAMLLAALFGGVFVGSGCAITFLGGGSTGGVDIIAFTVCKFFNRLKSSAVLFAIDSATVILGMFIIGDLVLTLLGVTSAFIAALAVDKIFIGSSSAFMAQIISDNHEAINKGIIQKLGRTATIVDAVGGYTGNKKKLILVSFSANQYGDLLSVLSSADKNAFISIHRAHEIGGEGWS